MNQTVRLENWHMTWSAPRYWKNEDSLYKSPEQIMSEGAMCFGGNVYGHPRFNDGDPVVTTRIKMTCGKNVMTKNTHYVLGEVDPKYDEWMKKNHPDGWDAENPNFGDK